MLRDGESSSRTSGIMGPVAETPDHIITTGLNQDLDEAMLEAVRAGIAIVAHRTGLSPSETYASLSAAGNLTLTQVVDGVVGVRAGSIDGVVGGGTLLSSRYSSTSACHRSSPVRRTPLPTFVGTSAAPLFTDGNCRGRTPRLCGPHTASKLRGGHWRGSSWPRRHS